MAKKQLRQIPEADKEASFVSSFFAGFVWPLKKVAAFMRWLGSKPPLKQLFSLVRWFIRLKPVQFIFTITGLRYLYKSWKELKGVTWPTFRESLRLTGAVVLFSVVFGVIVAVIDYFLDRLFKEVLLK